MTPGSDPTQVDWNNPDVEYLMKNFEIPMADRRDEIVSLTRSNNQAASEKGHLVSKNKELEERCLHLEAKYDKLIEMYAKIRYDAGNDAATGNTPKNSDAESSTTSKQRSRDSKKSSYNVRIFTWHPWHKPHARNEDGRPRGDRVVHEMVTADGLVCVCVCVCACCTCDSAPSSSVAAYPNTTKDPVNCPWQKTVWKITRRYCKKCRRQ